MLIYPAIDLIEGRCVRLLHGDFAKATVYGDPVDQALAFAEAGAEWVHVVDLDGARSGARRQTALVGMLARAAGVRIQCGGGVRAHDDVSALLEAGADRVVIGSAAVRDPESVKGWIAEFGPDRICCAFDVRAGADGAYRVATNGWTADGGPAIESALAAFPAGGLRHALVTDISRDGALTGANTDLLRSIIAARPDLDLQASGGVASLGDLDALRATGAAGAIVGRAFYERKFTLEAALGR